MLPVKSFYVGPILVLIGLVLASANSPAHAGAVEDIASIKSQLEIRTPPLKAKSIKPSPIPGLYEVFSQGNLFYTDKNFSVMFLKLIECCVLLFKLWRLIHSQDDFIFVTINAYGSPF